MRYPFHAIEESDIPRAANPILQHLLDTYASETNKVVSVWSCFATEDLDFRPHPKSSTVRDILKHQLLSERRFFAEFIGTPEPLAEDVLPASLEIKPCTERMIALARPRLQFFAGQTAKWWMETVPFFGEPRERIWVFWRRVLHTCHHRAQLAVYLRMLNKPVPSVYGPTADETWDGADATHTVASAGRK